MSFEIFREHADEPEVAAMLEALKEAGSGAFAHSTLPPDVIKKHAAKLGVKVKTRVMSDSVKWGKTTRVRIV
jgi:hypothetical protein